VRTAITASAIAHVLLWAPIAWPGLEPPARPPEPILVEIVSPEEIGEAPKPQAPAETEASEAAATVKSEPQAAAPPPQPQDPARQRQQQRPRPPAEPVRTASAAPAVPPPPAAPMPDRQQPWSSWFDTALSSPLLTANAGADVSASPANLSPEDIAAFKAHLQGCWNPPAALAVADQNLLVVLRVSFKPNGALTAEPALLAASASENGPALMQTAMRALRQCQPYGFLPAAKYKEWKVLDLSFSPTGLGALPTF
jgi:hypothetical protein